MQIADATRLRRIGEVADATGLTQRAIRYYEEMGLLKPAAHISGANRRYDDEDLERLKLIKRLREVVGLGLADIKTYLETEAARSALRLEFDATTSPARRAQIVDELEPILRRRVALLERKLAAVHELLDEDLARIQRIEHFRSSVGAGEFVRQEISA